MKTKEQILLSMSGHHHAKFLISLFCLMVAIFQISCATPPQKPIDQAMVSSELSKDATRPTQPEDRLV
ncbi:MAG TPA: hypothetical protein VEM15_14330, partial [Thermodesulfobacteriota bacterium]|nr:hypothetical protein [Thermodesulfobacteriota bacterium]